VRIARIYRTLGTATQEGVIFLLVQAWSPILYFKGFHDFAANQLLFDAPYGKHHSAKALMLSRIAAQFTKPHASVNKILATLMLCHPPSS
jgi:hypothetical protein